jgi:hypothetical protein
MTFISRLGRKLGSVGRAGGKLLSKFGRMGTKVTGGITKVMDTVERIPLVGDAVKGNKVYQGLRGVVAGANKVSLVASKAGQILEATPSDLKGAYQTAGKLKGLGRAVKSSMIGSNISGQGTLASMAAGKVNKDASTRTNHGATGNISVGEDALMG